MNIQQAKEQIRNAMKAYFTRDEYGRFLIPPEEQRPVFLMGPPGIGKTAIMKQIAGELGVNLVSYSMTHHTRQSALGLPVIVHRNYNGTDTPVSEYTMSEIIASVYDTMEETGVKQGILFLDEINCVSETLTPTMLQFLQYKTFGRHRVPDGWIVVTAGNPPEYNRSAREFDIVTWDRLKRIDIEPDFSAWRSYAREKGVHSAVLTYLDAKKENFYRVEQTAEGKHFVTARGWTDLSTMLQLYERNDIPVDELLISQYIREAGIAGDFANYYDLFNKYRSDYRVDRILADAAPQDILDRARTAPFDERLSLIGLLLSSTGTAAASVIEKEDVISALLPVLKEFKAGAELAPLIEKLEEQYLRDERRGALTAGRCRRNDAILSFLRHHREAGSPFPVVKSEFDGMVAAMRASAAETKAQLEAMFHFAEQVWTEGQELVVLLTELTVSPAFARFVSRYGCDAYYRHNQALMFHERRLEILKDIDRLKTEL